MTVVEGKIQSDPNMPQLLWPVASLCQSFSIFSVKESSNRNLKKLPVYSPNFPQNEKQVRQFTETR